MMYKKKLGAVLSKVEQDFIVMKKNEVYRVNEVGARIFDLCSKPISSEDITIKISKKMNESLDSIVDDVNEFIEMLLEYNLIEMV